MATLEKNSGTAQAGQPVAGPFLPGCFGQPLATTVAYFRPDMRNFLLA